MTSSVEDPFDWVGATLDGRYQVDAVVGRGGFGVVYRAHHLGFDEKVAIKCLRIPQTLGAAARDDFERNFLAEGRLLHQLSRSTAGIVQALDVGAVVSPNKIWTPFIVLEWLDGQSLEAEFSERRRAGTPGRGLDEALELLGSAARALAIAHEQGIAHRDIKPANLFLAEVFGRTTLKVLDFGIAKVVTESESFTKAFEETGTSLQAFTARYGAPEQFSRHYGATGPWSDVFSLALVLVEAVVGHSALEGVDAAQLFIAAADRTRRPTLRAHGFDASPAVEAVLERALAVDSKERYGSAGEFWNALVEAHPTAGEDASGLPSPHASRRSPATQEDAAAAVGQAHHEADRAPVSPPGSAATELTASTKLADAAPKPRLPAERVPRLVAGSVLGVILLGGLAVWHQRTPTFTAEGVSASTQRSAEAAGHDSAAPRAAPAPEAPAPAAPSFGGLPVRDVPAGPVQSGGAWLDKFGVLRREDSRGLDYLAADARCAEVGKALCTESQWQRACDTFPEVGQALSWTASQDDGRVVVRGGGDCSLRKRVAATERAAERIGLCCDRAIAMSSSSLQKPFLSSTAAVVLKLEKALNQRSADSFLELSEDHVLLDGHSRDQAALGSVLKQSFSAASDLVVLNDQCDITVSAKKVVKRSRRIKKTTYETTGWTATCKQTRHRDGKVLSAKTTYEFSATSKLRAVSDSEAPAVTE